MVKLRTVRTLTVDGVNPLSGRSTEAVVLSACDVVGVSMSAGTDDGSGVALTAGVAGVCGVLGALMLTGTDVRPPLLLFLLFLGAGNSSLS